MSFKVILENEYNLDKRITSLINLFKEIDNDFTEHEPLLLKNIDNESFEKVLNFCKIINYEKLKLPKPLYLNSKEIREKLKSNRKLENFYNNDLKLNCISNLINTVDFLGFECLENLIYFKIYDELIFKKNSNISNNDNKKNCEENKNTIDYNKSEIIQLYDKYIKYYENFVNGLSEEEVNKYLENNFQLE